MSTAARTFSLAILALAVGCGDDDAPGTLDAATGVDAASVAVDSGGVSPDAGSPITSCDEDVDCPAAQPACNVSVGLCTDCHTDAMCDVPEPYCSAAGYCLECLTNTHCAAPTPVCGELFGCVECLEHSDCPAERPQCDLPPRGFRCLAPCRADVDCATVGRGRLCDTSTGICIACRTDDDCMPGVCTDGTCRGPR